MRRVRRDKSPNRGRERSNERSLLITVPTDVLTLLLLLSCCCCVAGKDRKMFTLLTLKDTKTQLWQLYEKFLAEVLVKKQTAKLVLL